MKVLKVILLLSCGWFASPVMALHCGNWVIDVGALKQQVLKKCGEAASIDTHIERRAVSNSAGISQYSEQGAYGFPITAINLGQQRYYEIDVVVEEWLYNFGRSRFQQLLRFENGRLVEIKELDYGY